MQAVILLIVVFLYNGDVKTVSAVAPSGAACLAVREQVVSEITADKAVRFANVYCVQVDGGEKA